MIKILLEFKIIILINFRLIFKKLNVLIYLLLSQTLANAVIFFIYVSFSCCFLRMNHFFRSLATLYHSVQVLFIFFRKLVEFESHLCQLLLEKTYLLFLSLVIHLFLSLYKIYLRQKQLFLFLVVSIYFHFWSFFLVLQPLQLTNENSFILSHLLNLCS